MFGIKFNSYLSDRDFFATVPDALVISALPTYSHTTGSLSVISTIFSELVNSLSHAA